MNVTSLRLTQHRGAISFQVRVAPRSARAAVTGVHQGALKVSLTAPPVQGAANAALVELLAAELRLPKRAISIVRGQRSKTKTVSVRDIGPDVLLTRLAPPGPGRDQS